MRYDGPFTIVRVHLGLTRVLQKLGQIIRKDVVVSVMLKKDNNNRNILRHANISDIKPYYVEDEELDICGQQEWDYILSNSDAFDIVKRTADPLWDQTEELRKRLDQKSMLCSVSNSGAVYMDGQTVRDTFSILKFSGSLRFYNNSIWYLCQTKIDYGFEGHLLVAEIWIPNWMQIWMEI